MQIFPARQSHFGRSVAEFSVKRLPVRRLYKRNLLVGVFVVGATLLAIAGVSGQQFTFIPDGTFFANPNGASETYSTTGGGVDLTGPFFQSLGTNGRSCATCHQPSDAMSVAAANVQQRFDATQGLDPIFRTNDGPIATTALTSRPLQDDPPRIIFCVRAA